MEERDEVALKAAFTEVVGKPVHAIGKSEGGLDNSVYFIHLAEGRTPQYVLKIIESKEDKQIQDTIILSQELTEFTKLDFYKKSDGDYLHSSAHLDKKFVVMNFISGRHPDISNPNDAQAVAEFSAKLHNAMPRRPASPKELLEKELELVNLYYSNALVHSMEAVAGEHGEWYKERASTYRNCKVMLGRILDKQKILFDDESHFLTRGFAHGDLNAGNMLIDADNRISFIDPDTIDRDSFQITDVLQALSKSNIVDSTENTDAFLDHYLDKKGDCHLDKSMLHTIIFCLSFRSALSTDYYTKNVGTIEKISTKWVHDNAKDTLDKLSNTLKKTAKMLGVDAGIFDKNKKDTELTR